MAGRRTKRKNGYSVKPEQAVSGVVGVGLLALIANNPSTFAIIIFAILGSVAALWFFKHARRRAAHKKMFETLAASIEQHKNALISYYHQSRSEDLFGNQDEARWHGKIDTFLKNQVVGNIADFPAWRRSPIGQQAAAKVYAATAQKITAYRATNPLARVDTTSLTPTEYEMHCAELLKAKGWIVRTTPKTRDGGADLIAEKHDWRLVVQCKRYAQPVGNKAVQEVHSAKSLYNGNIACVIAPMGFTRQAQQEAHSHAVHLLHHSALPAFAEQLAV